MSTAKNEVQQLLNTLPDDCSLEDIQYHLYVIEKVRNGLEIADTLRSTLARGGGATVRQMAYRVRWSPRATDDLEAIAQYISLDSPAYAKAVVKTILEITRKFSQFPFAGRVVPELNDEIFVNVRLQLSNHL